MKKTSLIICLVCLLATSIGLLSANALINTDSIINAPTNFIVTKDYAIPDGTGEITDTRHGLLLTTEKKGSYKIASEMSGDFELDFKVFSNVTGHNDFNALNFIFTDSASGESFKVYYNMQRHEDFEEKGIGKAFVTFPNGQKKFGAYEGDLLLDYEWGGAHTSSFNNKKSENKSTEAGVNKIKFDPLSKEIFIYAFEDYNLLVDLDEPKSVARAKTVAVTGFNKYSVVIELDEFTESVTKDAPANMLLYSLNGQLLDGQTLTNSVGASVVMDFEIMSVEGFDYVLPKPIMYDVIDGYTDFNGEITVKTFPGGKAVPLENGVLKNLSFGKYLVTLSGAKDSGGLLCEEKSFQFTTLLSHPGHEMVFNEELISYEIGVGSEIFIPGCTASSKINFKGELKTEVSVIIKKDGATVKTIENITGGVFYTINEAGKYTFNYSSKDEIGHTVEKSFTVDAIANAPIINIDNIEGTYKLDSEFIKPTVTASLSGAVVEAKTKIISPFGAETTLLDKVGDYKFIASVESAGKTYEVTRGFKVKREASQMFINKRASEITSNATSPSYAMNYNGVKVSASRSNSTVQYVTPIDITKLNKEVALIDILPLARQKDLADFGLLTITLTDVNNPKSSISVKISRSYDRGYYWLSLVRAGINNNNYAGWSWGQLKVDEGTGTNMTTSFLGASLNSDLKAISGQIYFDYASKTFYCGYFEDKLPILDLDAASDVGAGNEWQGFSSNMAYLTITANSLENRTAEYMVISVVGQPLGGTYLESSSAVKFDVDMKGNEQAPCGKIGVKYPIFNARAYDNINSNIPFETEVYFDYGKTSQEKLAISSDNSFTPNKNGKYSIVYFSGKDKKRVDIMVKDLEPITYTLEENYPKNIFVGEEFYIPGGIADGGSGIITATYQVTLNGENLELKSNIIKPLTSGEISVVMTLTDYLGQTFTKTYKINANVSDAPILTNEISMPNAIIAGKDYIFTPAKAKYYTDNNEVDAAYDIFVTNGGETTTLQDRKYTPNAKDIGKDISVKYRIYNPNDKALFVDKIFTVKIIKPEYKNEFFVSESGITSKVTTEGAEFTVTENKAKMQFVNTLSSAFEFMFSVPTALLSSIDFYFTDSDNANIKVKLSIVKVGDRNNLYINGKKGGLMAGVFGGSEFMLKMHGNEVYNIKDSLCGTIEETIYGKAFKGFTSNKVYLDIVFNGVNDTATFKALSLNGQLFDQSAKDMLKPTIFIDGEINRTANYGETITIPAATALDVLDPYTTIHLTVKGPRGWIIFDKVDISKSVSFKAEKYGQYIVTYFAVDARKNPSRIVSSISVFDNIPPEIEVIGEMPTECRVNQEITLPQFKVTDNNDNDLVAYIHYVDQSGRMVRIKDNKFKPTEMGTYTISVFAKDKSYSNVRLEYTIRVGK